MFKLAALLATLFIVSMSVQPLAAQSSSAEATTAPPAPDNSQTEAAIRSLEEQERWGVLAQDFAALERIWAEEFIVNSPFNQIAPNRAVVLDIFRQGMAQYVSFERRIEEIRMDGDLVIVMGGETVRPTGKAPRAGETIERRFTHVWRHDGSAWKLIARHANNITPTP